MGGKPRKKPEIGGLGAPGGRGGVWPVAILHSGAKPVISDGFGLEKRGGRGHLGVDIMFRRPRKGLESRPDQTRWYECPTGEVWAIACAPGKIWSIKDSPKNGGVVKISHGFPHLAVYRHLAETFVVPGQEVIPGTILGIVGHAPSAGKRGINHLHFEIWDVSQHGKRSRRNLAIDPEPWLVHWDKIEAQIC